MPDQTAGAEGAPAPADVPPAPAVLTEASTGGRFALDAGAEVALRLSSAWAWDEPELASDAVTLSPVDHLQDPGYREWTVSATAPGTVELLARGTPQCADPAQCPPTTVRLTLDIRP